MKLSKIACMAVIALGLIFTVSFAAGGVEKGKALFNDASFAGGVKACSSCHPNGKGLEKAAEKKEFKTQNGLEERINSCIVNANRGKALDVNSEQMKSLVSYIKSLKGKKATSGY